MVATATEVAARVPAARQQRTRAANRRRLGFGVWWWAAPGVVLVILGQYIASGFGAGLAFTDARGYAAPEWVGFANFQAIFTTPAMTGAVINTLVVAAAFVVFTNVAALGFALLLNRTLRSRHVLQALVFAPAVLSPLAVAYVFRFIFEHDGALNALLAAVGLGAWERTWLGDPTTALWTVIVVLVWQNVGMLMVIYLAGLTAIPPELEEAAAVDGAGIWARFWHVVRPLLKPAALIAITLTLVNGLKVFDQVMAMTGGGPYGASDTLATVMYRYTYSFGDYGLGAALALTLSVLILIAAGIQQWVMRTKAKEIA
jgi:raffinose/stachyose/melibiose transport system permease protein